ncbi:hypothetical protein [uncultured Desulfosarcina sp.]|uniref:phosphorylase family protein n=1 Tax=uncultured Desulfosarcina sp. TaxID=218289 RepID=UPI0029C9489E|nr:hypothetical protein [uncultured Desulfosarcina sp.]
MIKLLIIEDDQKKLQKISETLCSVDGINHDKIDHVVDVTNAKRLLRTTSYDLLILDIVIPLRVDTNLKKDAGIILLKEILERDSFQIPHHIIAVTQHDEIFDSLKKEFANDLITFIKYSPDDSSTLLQIKRKAGIIVCTKFRSQNLSSDYSSYIAMICATERPELQSLLNNGWDWQLIQMPNDATSYYQTTLEKDDKTHIVHAACAPKMGMTAAAILSGKMVNRFKPKYLIMSGITAGYKDETNLGDVIVADPVWDWGAGKWTENNSQLEFLHEPHQIPLDSLIRDKFSDMARNEQLLFDIRKKWKAKSPKHDLRILVGPSASGAAVLADGEICEKIRKQHRKLLGIEMEAYAIYSAAFEAIPPKPIAFSAKAVVDFADGNKDDSYHEYAAYTSSEVVKTFIEAYL